MGAAPTIDVGASRAVSFSVNPNNPTIIANASAVSASNVLTNGHVSASKIGLSNLPTEESKAANGGLFTLSGSQLPFATGSVGSTVRQLFNSFSGSKFVLIK